jgi:hypothetical protein
MRPASNGQNNLNYQVAASAHFNPTIGVITDTLVVFNSDLKSFSPESGPLRPLHHLVISGIDSMAKLALAKMRRMAQT